LILSWCGKGIRHTHQTGWGEKGGRKAANCKKKEKNSAASGLAQTARRVAERDRFWDKKKFDYRTDKERKADNIPTRKKRNWEKGGGRIWESNWGRCEGRERGCRRKRVKGEG